MTSFLCDTLNFSTIRLIISLLVASTVFFCLSRKTTLQKLSIKKLCRPNSLLKVLAVPRSFVFYSFFSFVWRRETDTGAFFVEPQKAAV